MDQNCRILLVTNNPASAWVKAVTQILAQMGEIRLVWAQDTAVACQEGCYDIALIDTSALAENAADLVAELADCQDNLPIVVVTTSPTWQRAREVFLAGATDYVRRTFDEEKLRHLCQSAITRRKAVVRPNDSLGG